MAIVLLEFTYSRVEQASTDAEEDPYRDCQREAECQGDVEQRSNVHGPGTTEVVGDLRSSEGEEQKEEGADKFTCEGDEEMASSIW